ncbi:O-methyltransferase [Acrocarpospora catenulata]|uniref:O-methyltransferase n=1 Tax=Acrocarpospora catenulata TaxID=2836182 RepID=UPI001BD98231|nr:O-methyltransferase [Acrocarpospora catenulata]
MTTLKASYTDPSVPAYVAAHATQPDQLLRELAVETAAIAPDNISMQIAPEQGALLTMLVQLTGARLAVEVGTFTGYSSICIARGLAPDGRLICCDVSQEWTAVARRYWERAGLTDRVELRLGPALGTLTALPEDEPVDFAFIDADKAGYPDYYRELVRRLAPGGLICVDNTLQGGRITDPGAGGNVPAMRAFNDLVTADPRVDSVLVPIADGLTLIRRR